MKIYYGTDQVIKLTNAVVTAGTFDGVHLGHTRILNNLRKKADLLGGETVVITYHPHPRQVLPNYNGTEVKLLSTMDEKTEMLRKYGVDAFIIIPFTPAFASISSSDFVKDILVAKIGTKRLVIGHDHRFGRNREGTFEYLQHNAQAFGFEVEEIPAQDVEAVTVSSTRIRQALQAGNLQLANEYLGRNYSLSGTVLHGKGVGRTLNFPTANISLSDPSKLIPAEGVYAVLVTTEGTSYKGLLSIGTNPTLGENKQTIEAWLMDFDGDLYGKTLTVEFVEYLRGQVTFKGLPELKAAIQADEAEARLVFANRL